MTSQRQQLRTEAVQRFEKFLDTRLAEKALDMIVTMISELHPEAHFKGISFDQKIETLVTEPIQFNYKELLEYGGMPMSPKEATGILERLGFKVAFNKENGTISATKPLFRSKQDISIKQDVIEEILRVYGYYKIKPRKPVGEITLPPKNPVTHLKWELSDELIGKGFIEVRNYTFLSSNILEEFGFSEKLAFKNPVSDQMNSLRPTLVPHLLQTMENNLVLAGDEQRYFEIGTIVDPTVQGENRMPDSDTFLAYQPTVIGGLYYSKMKHPLLQLKDIVANGLKENGYTEIVFESMNSNFAYLHPFQSYWLTVDGTIAGYVGSLHPEILQKHKLSGYHTTVFEIDLFKLAGVRKIQKTYVATSKFPPIKRDYAFMTPELLSIDTILATIRSVDEIIAEAYVFDVYRGKNLPEHTKSVAIRVFYSDFNKTLKEEDIEKIEKKLISAMQNAGCEQR
jgi:phenylalanyl-tRNA synthetase beta chain